MQGPGDGGRQAQAVGAWWARVAPRVWACHGTREARLFIVMGLGPASRVVRGTRTATESLWSPGHGCWAAPEAGTMGQLWARGQAPGREQTEEGGSTARNLVSPYNSPENRGGFPD